MTEAEFTEQNNALMAKWKDERPAYVPFITDGILVYDVWRKQNPKILFLLKETYGGYNNLTGGEEYNTKSFFWTNVVLWKTAIYEFYKSGFVDISQHELNEKIMGIASLTKKLDDIAILDVKKWNENKSRSSWVGINKYAKSDHEFIEKQIELINPDVIVCGGTFYSLKNYIYKDVKLLCGLNLPTNKKTCHKYGGRLIIDYFHPSHSRYKGGSVKLLNEFCELLRKVKCKEIIG